MIFCFSACGNTAAAASHLARLLGEKVQAIRIDSPTRYDVRTHKRIVWAFPIYSWGVPEAVLEFIKKAQIAGAENVGHYMMATCGDDSGLADKMWAKAMRKRGWKSVAAHTVIMPNTYVALPGFDTDSRMLEQEKLIKASARIEEIAHAIKCGSPISSITRGRMAWLKTRVIYPLFVRMHSPRKFKALPDCNSCGLCSRVCPLGNITMVNNYPQWGNRCTTCLACYHHCPQHAVAYGKRTRGKGQYVAPKELPQ